MARTKRNSAGAAIDIGSNSVHLLVSRIAAKPGKGRRLLEHLVDRSELLGLGALVDAHGGIPKDARDQLVEAIAAYQALTSEAGATSMTLIGTEPMRRATNSDAVIAEVLDTTGLELHVISVEQEAQLTFMGVTQGGTPGQSMIVVDIGGGSTEVGMYVPGNGLSVVPLPVGSARLTSAHIKHDPPTEAELDNLYAAVEAIRGRLPRRSYFGPPNGLLTVFVGGTATNLERLGRLSREGLAADRRTLGELDAATITQRFGVRPQRAPQLAAGAAIVDVLLDHFGLDQALVSGASLRDGAIVADWLFGDEWPQRLAAHFA